MDPLIVVEKYCKKNNVKFELLPENTGADSNLFKRDNIMRITKLSKEKQYTLPSGFVPAFYMEYNENPQCLKEKMEIIDVLNACKDITIEYQLDECCVCFKLTRIDIFKCRQCVNITCNKCLLKDVIEKNRKIWTGAARSGLNMNDVANMMINFEKKCPVCRCVHGY